MVTASTAGRTNRTSRLSVTSISNLTKYPLARSQLPDNFPIFISISSAYRVVCLQKEPERKTRTESERSLYGSNISYSIYHLFVLYFLLDISDPIFHQAWIS